MTFMEEKIKLADYIEEVKEKLTSKEYKDMLEILRDIKVNKNESEEEPEPEERRLGYRQPSRISTQLSKFLNVPEDTLISVKDAWILCAIILKIIIYKMIRGKCLLNSINLVDKN